MLAAQTFEGVLSDLPVNDGNVNFNMQQTMAPIDLAQAKQVHPAGGSEVLRALLKRTPIQMARTILMTCKTLDEIKAEVERYRKDPNRTA